MYDIYPDLKYALFISDDQFQDIIQPNKIYYLNRTPEIDDLIGMDEPDEFKMIQPAAEPVLTTQPTTTGGASRDGGE